MGRRSLRFFATFLFGLAIPLAASFIATAQPLILQGGQGPDLGPPPAPAPPPQMRGVPAKAVSEETIVNRDLKLNGSSGTIRIERAGRSADLKARLVLPGTRLSQPGEACTVKLDDAVPLTARGRTDGLARYEFEMSACPIAVDLVDGALFVKAGACSIEPSDCRVEASGLWGPEPAALMAQARTIEQDRGQADRAVRENYKALTQRARPQDVRAVVGEQAAFSSEREMACRSYAREAIHGFCNARYTEARAALLASRLGLVPAASPARTGAPRRPAPIPIRPPPPSLFPGQQQ